jgi:hypothetical protein
MRLNCVFLLKAIDMSPEVATGREARGRSQST